MIERVKDIKTIEKDVFPLLDFKGEPCYDVSSELEEKVLSKVDNLLNKGFEEV